MQPRDPDGSVEVVGRAGGWESATGSDRTSAQEGVVAPRHAAAGSGLERRLLRNARAGDHRAFVALLRAHEPRLRALAFRVLRDPDTVADALQEAALRAYRSLHTFRDDSAVGTWLFRLTYNVCLDQLVARERQIHLVERAVAQTRAGEHDLAAPDPAEAVAAGDRLARALDGLSPEHRAVVYLCIQQDLDLATAAEVLDIPYGTVGSRLNHARQVLRRALEGDER